MGIVLEGNKVAVVLFNLGGPTSLESVEPFLYNLFSDPAIISLPVVLRLPIAKFIAWRRAPVARAIYKEMGGKSPLFEQTRKQAELLEARLKAENPNVEVFVSMRYWDPMSTEVAERVKAWRPDHIILLPLYPQYSKTTTGSSFKDWEKAAKQVGLKVPTSKICCYPAEQDFIIAHAKLIKERYFDVAAEGKPRILFSAHGLPEKVIKSGDPYQSQVEETAQKIIKLLAIDDLDYVVCYQSRVGPMRWIGPPTDSEILRAGQDKVPVILVPIAFVSEHSETLVELDIEYRQLAVESGVPVYARIPALSANEHFIESLANMVMAVDGNHRMFAFTESFEESLVYPWEEKKKAA